MTLKNAAFFALAGMVLLTLLVTASLVINVSGVVGGYVPFVALLTSIVQWLASLSLLVFFAVYHRTL
jgi:hypothetical protein